MKTKAIDAIVSLVILTGAIALMIYCSGCTGFQARPVLSPTGVEMHACYPAQLGGDPAFARVATLAADLYEGSVGRELFIPAGRPAQSVINMHLLPIEENDRALAKTVFGSSVGCSGRVQIIISPKVLERSNVTGVRIILHELGHALGLGHQDDPGNLMAPNIPPPDKEELGELREEQLELIRRLYDGQVVK